MYNYTQITFVLIIIFTIVSIDALWHFKNEFGMPYGWRKKPVQVYDFGYDIKDKFGNKQWRKEGKNKKGEVIGSYGFVNANGIQRFVNYIADDKGFRVKITSNEPGTANQHPAYVHMLTEPIRFSKPVK